MKNLIFKASILVVAASLPLSFANAAKSNKPFQPFGANNTPSHSYYLGGSVGSAGMSDYCENQTDCKDKTTSWKVYGGYQITEMLTLEGSYFNLGSPTQKTVTAEDGSTSTEDVSVKGYSGALLAGFPVSDKIRMFGKAGLYKKRTEEAQKDFSDTLGKTYGFGADFEFTDNIAIRGEWEKFTDLETLTAGKKVDAQLMSVGMTFSSL